MILEGPNDEYQVPIETMNLVVWDACLTLQVKFEISLNIWVMILGSIVILEEFLVTPFMTLV